MKEICFIVNVDHFFDSHRRQLERLLARDYDTQIIAGDTSFKTPYHIDRFQVKSRLPTLSGIRQLLKFTKKIDEQNTIIVVTPMMIVLCHFLLYRKTYLIYNWSGLGFLRSGPSLKKWLILNAMLWFPVCGTRMLVAQNTDDLDYLVSVFGEKKNFKFCLIPGSGFDQKHKPSREFNRIVLGYVGRVRKDKGVLNVIRAVQHLQNNGCQIDLKIWGELDDHNRHGFNSSDLAELETAKHFFHGYSDDKVKIYQSFNVFCLASSGEGLSKAAIEAASFGMPLILSKVPGNKDMINANGFLFEYDNSHSLIEVLETLCELEQAALFDFSKQSRLLFEQLWTLDSIHKEWLRIL